MSAKCHKLFYAPICYILNVPALPDQFQMSHIIHALNVMWVTDGEITLTHRQFHISMVSRTLPTHSNPFLHAVQGYYQCNMGTQ